MEKRIVPCEVYSRVVGYFRPVHNWNDGKREEFNDRVAFSEKASLENPKAKGAVMPLVGGGTESIDSYKIFTFPHCDKCEEVKEFLSNGEIEGKTIDLKSPEGNKEFRQHYTDKSIRSNIKREEDGTLKLPIVMFMGNGCVVSTAQGIEETKAVLS